MKIAVVSGSQGGIGHAVMIELASRGYQACGMDILGEPNIDVTYSLKEHFDEYIQRGKIKLLVNCVGITQPDSIRNPQFGKKIFAINYFGVINVCKTAVKYMKKGSIVNVASKSASYALPDRLSYCASKGALVSASRQMAVDLTPDIRVNTVSPGIIDTDMNGSVVKEMKEVPNLLKRKGQPEEVAKFICDIAENPYVTGQDYIIDGGYSVI